MRMPAQGQKAVHDAKTHDRLRACSAGGTMTAVMSAANEKAVEVFLREEIEYLDIVPLVSACCEAHKADLTASPTIDDIVSFDQWARDWTQERAKTFKRSMAAV